MTARYEKAFLWFAFFSMWFLSGIAWCAGVAGLVREGLNLTSMILFFAACLAGYVMYMSICDLKKVEGLK